MDGNKKEKGGLTMAGQKEILKVNNINIRCSETDMKDLEYLCRRREMSKTEMILYLIRREADKYRDFDQK